MARPAPPFGRGAGGPGGGVGPSRADGRPRRRPLPTALPDRLCGNEAGATERTPPRGAAPAARGDIRPPALARLTPVQQPSGSCVQFVYLFGHFLNTTNNKPTTSPTITTPPKGPPPKGPPPNDR